MRCLAIALAVLVASCQQEPYSPAPTELKIIAHRGGVVGDEYAENSPAAIEAAVEREYWMVELDVRESRDSRLVVHHDEDFGRFYGEERRLAEMSWDDISQLRATPGASRPHQFAEMAALCKGRLQVMLDTKPPEHSEDFLRAIEDSLAQNGLLDGAYIIGTDQSRTWFHGKARVGVDRNKLRAAVEGGEDVARLYFLFEHGRDLDAETVRYAQALGVPVVPSINIFHYEDLADHMATAEMDVKRMLELGVEEFQIDSPYDVWLRR